MNNDTAVTMILRIGLAFAFLYPAVSSIIDPASWIGFLPEWTRMILPTEMALIIFSVIEIAVGAGILFLRKPAPAAYVMIGILLLIVAVNWRSFDIVFRDITIAASAFALILLKQKE